MAVPERTARIIATRTLSPTVRSLLLDTDLDHDSAAGGERFAFIAGQWLHLHVRTPHGVEKRAYSIASAPDERPLELAVTFVPEGAVSPILHALTPGTELRYDGPHGFFTHSDDARTAPSLFVGTGTGLCPLRSMLGELLADPEHPPVTLLFGVRSQQDILWREQLESWAARDPRFKLAVTLSRPEADWNGRVGYVQAHVVELARELGAPHVFICGLSRMVSEVRAVCKNELGYDRKRIHSERYD